MKKTFLIMFISVLCAGFANAQIHLGGSLGFGTGHTKPTQGSKLKHTSFSINPEVGYTLNPNFEFGIALDLSNSKEDLAGGGEAKSNSWGVTPYARYSFIGFGKFSIWGQGNVFFSGGKENSQKTTNFGLSIQPILKYDLSDHFTLSTSLNFLNIGFLQTKVKGASTTTNFGLGIDSKDVATLGAISVGVTYKF
jgi:hypothetical protein